ncbi:hypothetical protein INT43_001336 [Umbelopsis isabellina]|uniref:Enoyl reductase (ER) domain-containing protein n=1 Tax=Mortierella isabellina TaxID=91625 RepID=A0A8H7UDQ3_MORIS|nr:hypothetical protein INT43_001336 [Umbelopsis isabellina]
MSDQTELIRAWTHTKVGRPEKVINLDHVPMPKLSSAEDVLVKVSHIALLSSASFMIAFIPHTNSRPYKVESDFTGTVVETGSNVRQELTSGTEVFGITINMADKLELLKSLTSPNGSLVEYLVVNQNTVVIKPANIKAEIVSGMAGVGCTALEFMDAAALKLGDTILINGGSGAVGLLLLQLAKQAVGSEGRVVTTCSAAKIDMVKKYGADTVIDYSSHQPLTKYLADEYGTHKFDCIIDCYGSQELYTESPAYLANDKLFLNMAIAHPRGRDWRVSDILRFAGQQLQNTCVPTWLGGTNRRYKFISATPWRATLERVRKLIEDGRLTCEIDSVWGMDDAIKAYERFGSNEAQGRVVINVQG